MRRKRARVAFLAGHPQVRLPGPPHRRGAQRATRSLIFFDREKTAREPARQRETSSFETSETPALRPLCRSRGRSARASTSCTGAAASSTRTSSRRTCCCRRRAAARCRPTARRSPRAKRRVRAPPQKPPPSPPSPTRRASRFDTRPARSVSRDAFHFSNEESLSLSLSLAPSLRFQVGFVCIILRKSRERLGFCSSVRVGKGLVPFVNWGPRQGCFPDFQRRDARV